MWAALSARSKIDESFWAHTGCTTPASRTDNNESRMTDFQEIDAIGMVALRDKVLVEQ